MAKKGDCNRMRAPRAGHAAAVQLNPDELLSSYVWCEFLAQF